MSVQCDVACELIYERLHMMLIIALTRLSLLEVLCYVETPRVFTLWSSGSVSWDVDSKMHGKLALQHYNGAGSPTEYSAR